MAIDMIYEAPHYMRFGKIQPIEITRHMGFTLGNAVKYICRAGHKGDTIEDLRKAIRYLGLTNFDEPLWDEKFKTNYVEGGFPNPKNLERAMIHIHGVLVAENHHISEAFRLLTNYPIAEVKDRVTQHLHSVMEREANTHKKDSEKETTTENDSHIDWVNLEAEVADGPTDPCEVRGCWVRPPKTDNIKNQYNTFNIHNTYN